MNTLVTFATEWGSKYGGINSFNVDFLSAFAFAYPQSTQVICIVPSFDRAAAEESAKANVRLVSLPYATNTATLDSKQGADGVEQLTNLQIGYEPEKTIWLGHDRITGEAAIRASKVAGGHSAVIHHMSYDHYESYAENSRSAYLKTQKQIKIFEDADVILAVGPLLRDSAKDLAKGSKPVCMIIPGLAQIEVREAPSTFVAFLSGRLTLDVAPIKQGQLGVAAFAKAEHDALENGMPDALCKQPKLLVRGVDFENEIGTVAPVTDAERDLKVFAEEYGQKVINLHALPYTENREQLFSELAGASVALMPSWHEGFGLVAWEAIAAGVPLLLSKNSGVYRLLEEQEPGAEAGYVYGLEIRGKADAPFFRPEDLTETATALKEVAKNPGRARLKASRLRNILADYTWVRCAEQAATCFGWKLDKGFLPSSTDFTPSERQLDAPKGHDEFSPLKMPTPQWRLNSGKAESQLLRAEEALLPFDRAREPEIEKLNEWLDNPEFLQSLRLVTGEGGQGKTRLALELCKRRSQLGWHSGFLDSTIATNEMTARWRVLSELRKPLLIVIDYGETRQAAVLALIRAVLKHPPKEPVRILLLARDGGEWWDNLPGQDTECESFLTGYATTGPFRLTPLYATDPDRQIAFSTALGVFARVLNVNTPEVRVELVGEHFDRPLYIQMAALLALHGERPVTAEGITKALLNHERRYWRRLLAHFNWTDAEHRAEQMLALATLSGGFAISKEAKKIWDEASQFHISSSDFNSLFRELASLYPGTQGLEALRPDLLGEALVAQAVLRPEGESLLDAVVNDSAVHGVRRNALTVMARLSTHRVDLHETIVETLVSKWGQVWKDLVAVSTETVSRLPELAEEAFVRLPSIGKGNVAGLLAPILKDESVQFAKLSSLVYGFRAEKSRIRFEQRPADVKRMSDYASDLITYATALSRNGQLEQAKEIGFKSVDLSQRLTAKNRDRFEPGLADALDSYAGHLWRLGHIEEALKYVQQALEINERLSHKDANRFEPDYLVSLSNYATSLSDVGKDEEALPYARQALAINERLFQKNADSFEQDYALSLSNYASILSQVGKHDEALAYARQGFEISKRLTQKNPDRFEPNHALSLTNYASHLSDIGQNAEALEYAQQALEIRGRLTQKNADRFEPAYTVSLTHSAACLSGVGKHEEALIHARQAVEITRRLNQQNAERFEPDYGTTLINYATRLSEVGDIKEALGYARQALAIRERLVRKNAIRFAEGFFRTACFVRFLHWLRDGFSENDDVQLMELLAFIPNRKHSLMLLFMNFVEACQTSHEAMQLEALRAVDSHWNDLTITQRINSQSYWLCAVAWRAQLDSQVTVEWKLEWSSYVKQRNGQIPVWMLHVARRLGFEWPPVS